MKSAHEGIIRRALTQLSRDNTTDQTIITCPECGRKLHLTLVVQGQAFCETMKCIAETVDI